MTDAIATRLSVRGPGPSGDWRVVLTRLDDGRQLVSTPYESREKATQAAFGFLKDGEAIGLFDEMQVLN